MFSKSTQIYAVLKTLKYPRRFLHKCHIYRSSASEAPDTDDARIKCSLIPGDGVGPELTHAVQKVFDAAGVPVDFEIIQFSEINQAMSRTVEEIIASIRKNKVCLNGVLAIPKANRKGELDSHNMKMRRGLDLYANVVHARSLPGVKRQHNDVDCVIIRQQTEGEYSSLEHESVKGIVEALKIVSRANSQRIAKFAFDYATKHNRKKVTCVHKANIMKLGDGLFLRTCADMATLYPKIHFDNMIIDNCAMQMVSKPQQFDVLVTTNLYGNLLNNIAAGLVGGAGVVPGALYSAKYVIFEPGARHIYSEAAGKNVANPTALLLCSAKMLRHINLHKYGNQIDNAVYTVLKEGKYRTKDLGGHTNTVDFTRAVIKNLIPIKKEQ